MYRFKLTLVLLSLELIYLSCTGQQIGNYVSDGSCESFSSASKYWSDLDTNISWPFWFINPTDQNPKSGNGLIGATVYCDIGTCTYTNSRLYPRNKLKQSLKPNTNYCVKFYVVNKDLNTVAIDGYGIYFSDNSLDTISYRKVPLNYLIPQVQNATNNIISDTLNWTAVSGTFVANGNEKYMIIGNFKNNSSTNTLIINPNNVSTFGLGTDAYFDDFSCIELNLPAYGGSDKLINLGDSTFIGRQPDFAIDPACIWYKLPNLTSAIDTISGLWVKPTSTSTYVVRQELDCSAVKWDTVVVAINTNYVDLTKLRKLEDGVVLAPNPVSGNLKVFVSDLIYKVCNSVSIYNSLGQLILEKELESSTAEFEITFLTDGIYEIHLKSELGTLVRKFIKSQD